MRLSNIYKFLLVFMLGYLSLVAIHQVDTIRKVHTHFFNGLEQFVFNIFNPHIRTDFKVYEGSEGVPYTPDLYDYTIEIFDRRKWNRTKNKALAKPINIMNASLDITAMGPLILFLALLIATPINYKRKILFFFIGAFLIYFLIALKISYMLYENIESIQATGLWGSLSTLFGSAFRSTEFMLLNIVFVWVLVCIRSKEVSWFLQK